MGPQPRCQWAAAGRGPQARPECVFVQDFLPLEVTAGNSVLLLGHILILVVGANILMGQVRAPPIPHPKPGILLQEAWE